jgi:hypothetical protein
MKLDSIFHLITFASAELVLTAQWRDTVCSSPPSSMFVYDLRDGSSRKPSPTDIWPIGYQSQATERVFDKNCFGFVKVPISRGCCASFLYPESVGLLSSATHKVPSLQEALTAAPIDSTSSNYCQLTPTVNETIAGYKQIYYKADNSCIRSDDYQLKYGIRCSAQGELKLFRQLDCSGDLLETFQISSKSGQYNSTILGSFAGELKLPTGSQMTYSWVLSIPSREIQPRLNEVCDVVQLCLYGVAVLSFLWVLFHQFKMYRKKQTRYLLSLLVSQMLWILWLISRITVTFITFDNILDGIMFTLRNLASYSTVLISLSFLLKFWNSGLKTRIFAYTILFLIHMGLTGLNYTRFFRNIVKFPTIVFDLQRELSPWWIVFMFVWDCIPPIIVLLSLLRITTEKFGKRVYLLIQGDPYFCIGVLLQILNMGIYLFVDRVKETTEWLGSDRVSLSMNGFISCVLSIHAVLNYVLIERMSNFIKRQTTLTTSKTIDRSKGSK